MGWKVHLPIEVFHPEVGSVAVFQPIITLLEKNEIKYSDKEFDLPLTLLAACFLWMRKH